MINNNSSINETDCQLSYDSTEYKTLAVVRASVGLLSFIACLGVITIIFIFKKHRVFIQRLVLYLTIAAMIHSISYTTARINFYTPRPILDSYCYFGGLFNHYTAAVELISIWCIMISLFVKAMFRRNTQKLELFYIIATFFGPMLWFWVPVWLQSYGTSGGWCGIRFLKEDCSRYEDGSIIQFGIWYIPLYVSLTVIFLGMIIIAFKAIRDAFRWHGRFHPNGKQSRQIFKNEVTPLLWYPIIYLLLNSFSLISQIYQAVNPDNPSIVLTYFRVIISPLRGAIIALIYTLDKHTRKRLTPSHCRAIFLDCCHDDKVREYDTLAGVTDSYHRTDYIEYDDHTELQDSQNGVKERVN